MKKSHFHLDSRGHPRADFQPPNEVLGWYLEQDVQSCLASCDELLSACEEVVERKSTHWQATGNAHTIIITDTSVLIENEFSSRVQACKVSIKYFMASILGWKELIRSIPS